MIKEYQPRQILTLLFFLLAVSIVFGQTPYSNSNPPSISLQSKYSFTGSYKSPLNVNYRTALQSSTAISLDPDIKIYSGLGENILNSFNGRNAYLHLAAAVSTVLLIYTNTDYHVHKYFNEHEEYSAAARPVVRIGNYFPFIISGSLYAYGKFNKDNEAVGASFAVLQSTLLAFTYNSLLKAITGRPNPNWRENNNLEDLSKTFRFGFWRGGIFWGWPSGHTSSTMAVISALTNFYPEKTWLKIAGYSYVAYMIFAVSSLGRGGMHWFSDAIAAAFTAYAIGSTTGKFYRSKFGNNETGDAVPSASLPSIPVLNFSINF